jgi:selenide, water dikinase
LAGLPRLQHPDVLVGLDKADDAAVYRLSDDLAVIQTVDFFTPIVDDPFQFGAISAANSLSDIYAMGGEPLTALNIVGFPTKVLDLSVLTDILRGGAEVAAEAGAVLVGGHSVKAPELFYGLSVLGRVHPDRIVTNSGARPNDRLVLTKPLGTGILTTALKNGSLDARHLGIVTGHMRRLNRWAAEAMVQVGAHAATDVTGFGLLGHLYEMASNSGVDAYVYAESVPLLEGALEHAAAGDLPGGLGANRQFLANRATISSKCDPIRVHLLFDPQTSGGLLISVEASRTDQLMELLESNGELDARVIGEIRPGTGAVFVLP